LNLTTNEFGNKPTPYIDDAVTVTPIPISPPSPSPSQSVDPSKFSFSTMFQYPTPAFEGTEDQILQHKKEIVHEMFKMGVNSDDLADIASTSQFDEEKKRRSTKINVNLPGTTQTNITMAYFIQNRDSPGKFDVEKAKALNVPLGKLYSQLKAGENVKIPIVNETGETKMKTVRSEDVLGTPIPGKSVLILDIPGLQYVNEILENNTLNSKTTKNADIIVHMLSDEVASDSKYIKWMESFKKSSKVPLTIKRFLTKASGHGT
jgi:hypothetical protein